MDSDTKQNKKSHLLWVSFCVIALGLGSIAAISAWLQLSFTTPYDVVVVEAVDSPIKVKPDDPGGMAVPHHGLQVIDMLKSGITDSDEVETLRPRASAPEPPPIYEGKTNKENDASQKGNDLTATSNNSIDLSSPKNTAISSADITPEAADLNSKQDTLQKRKTARILTPKSKAKHQNGPFFVIQLAAFRNDEKAQEIASLLSEKHSSRLQGIRLETMRLVTNTNGVFFRVVSAPMARVDAESTCKKLRRAGQDCFLRKFASPDG